MTEDSVRIDLDTEIRGSESRKPWPSAKQAKTLVNKDGLRLVLFTMEQGATINEHQADGPITVHVLRGEIRRISLWGRDIPRALATTSPKASFGRGRMPRSSSSWWTPL